MVHRASIAWKVALALLLGAAVVFASPVLGAHGWVADDGMKDARVVGRVLLHHSLSAHRLPSHGIRIA